MFQKEVGQRKILIRWWTMDPKNEILIRLNDFANGTVDFHPNIIDTIFPIFSGDHGKGKHRFICKLVVRTKKHEEWSKVFPIGDISSSKDSCEIFKGTIKENLAKGINDIINGYVKFTIDDDEKWICLIINEGNIQYNPMFDDIIIIVPFVVGDYKFYSQMLGKEGYDSHWCPHCKLYRTEWQKGCVYTIDKWVLTSIKAQHQSNLATQAKGVDKRGVCEDPYFDIPVSNFLYHQSFISSSGK
jgi:hypothetical protein